VQSEKKYVHEDGSIRNKWSGQGRGKTREESGEGVMTALPKKKKKSRKR